METKWLKEALFSGMTANAFKLGTVLNLGWFWPRVTGCITLYRGFSMSTIDFDTILAVGAFGEAQIHPPLYLAHVSSTTYFYVVRRVNNCGDEECTLAAAVKVAIDADGELAQPQPNSIFEVKAEQMAGSKIQLVWFYSPLGQQSELVCFKVYYDAGTGQINYANALAVIPYTGRRFYSYLSDTLDAGRYLFAIRAEDAGGTENASLARIRIQLDTTSPDAVDVLSAESA